jgi:CRISPR-associated protein Cmr1
LKTQFLSLQFHTPAFLGNAEQNAQWRTPPFKHALREWWRVAYAADRGYNFDVADMRREEGLLFGNAWLENEFCKSLVRLRLSHWNAGSLKKNQWPGDSPVTHPEVKNRDNRPLPVGSALYLGFGPLVFDKQRRATAMKANAAIQADETATLALAWPTTHREAALRDLVERNTPRIEHALWLMHQYGAVGGRSRNGWGSYELSPLPLGEGLGVRAPLRPWRDCLNLDWPHAIGQDDKGTLIWQTQPHDDWKALMKTLAIIKIGLRTQFELALIAANGDKQKKDRKNQPAGIEHGQPQDRHWLAYPVTHHSVQPWDYEVVNGRRANLNLRLPNQLRFKVRRTSDGKRVGVIFHMPHLPPPAFQPNRAVIENVWLQVHRFLDAQTQTLQRTPE